MSNISSNKTPKQRMLRSNSTSNSSCNVSLSDIETLIENAKQDILNTIEHKVDKQTALIEKLLKQVEDLHGKNDQLEKRCLKLEEDMITMSTSIFDELNDRKRRKRNLIISGVCESSDGSVEERRNADEKQMEMLLEDLCIDDVDIVKFHRIGSVAEGRNRLLRVVCCDEDSKLKVLRHAKKLKGSSIFSNVFVNPDLTLWQRNEKKRMRDEFKRRKETGEKVMWRHGRIVSATNRDFH